MTARGRGPRPLAASVADITRPLFGKRGFADGAVVTDWPAIVGATLAAHSAPEKIVYPSAERRGGTLHLRIDSGGLATELQHLEPVLVERINGYFGYRAIARLRFVNGPLPPRTEAAGAPPPPPDADDEAVLADILACIDDAELKAHLEALGRSVLGRRKGRRRS